MESTFQRQPTTAAKADLARDPSIAASRILLVDDEAANVAVLKRILERDGFSDVEGHTSADAAMRSVAIRSPDLVLLDQHMPEVDGIALLERLRPLLQHDVYLPVIFLSGDTSATLRRRALGAGATDFIAKPFDPIEVVLRIGHQLERRRLHSLQQAQNEELERRVALRTAQLQSSERELLERLCRVAAYRDDATGAHTRRVGLAASEVALELGIARETALLIGAAAELHDIGKVGVPDDILLKPGRLTDEEMQIMRRHAQIGAAALAGSASPLLQLAEQIARWHHERWDGGGYPDGLRGPEIAVAARIVAVVDVADALSHDRPYRRAWEPERVHAEILTQAGTQFDPEVVAAYLRVAAAAGSSVFSPEER